MVRLKVDVTPRKYNLIVILMIHTYFIILFYCTNKNVTQTAVLKILFATNIDLKL